ncbi:MAG: bifunctional proline dehydrogenase/L-glutamate gamma-semialdehyde dehydrogenase PutA [Pseudomonadota bacterium]|nr:bifunctional proline dehydrogenase/L-glutamate gamma-semialdehyde dehydrogenase PutA [Pseudomonadota bacterium]
MSYDNQYSFVDENHFNDVIDVSDIQKYYRSSEKAMTQLLFSSLSNNDLARKKIHKEAKTLIKTIREKPLSSLSIEGLLLQYNLNSEEGIALMCLAEALLRVPDVTTINQLIEDKLGTPDWSKGQESQSTLGHAMQWGLILTGKVLNKTDDLKYMQNVLKKVVAKLGQPALRQAINKFMRVFASQFVLGETLPKALKVAKKGETSGYCYSYDMLGEAALTENDAQNYFESYIDAIKAIPRDDTKSIYDRPGISVKISAIFERYETSQHDNVMNTVLPRLKVLCALAKDHHIGLVIDAEEADRLILSLELLDKLMADQSLDDWFGLGLAVQAYQKRSMAVVQWLTKRARKYQRRLMVRLVKGAYWDTEIKEAQVMGLDDYPVYTEKEHTDLAYLACAHNMIHAQDAIYPMFATHNVLSVLTIKHWLGKRDDFEFQRLHGMGEQLYKQLMNQTKLRCRIYAPVGPHDDLLPYLVRRLLENGATSSFVNQIVDQNVPIDLMLASDPLLSIDPKLSQPNPKIPLPRHLFKSGRMNSLGKDLNNHEVVIDLCQQMDAIPWQDLSVKPLIAGVKKFNDAQLITNPANREHILGQAFKATQKDVNKAYDNAAKQLPTWQKVSIADRATLLRKVADKLEANYADFMRLVILEAGKTWQDAVDEIREAVDFLRYYADEAEKRLVPQLLDGPTGESNTLTYVGRGIAVCISPWNFPLAIFIGQISAALVAGNVVLAKPANTTLGIATKMIELFYEAGLPKAAIQVLFGDTSQVAKPLVADERNDLIMMTGSTQTAKAIQQTLAQRPGAITPLIAETGGQNAMIVDSSALPEQVVVDIIDSGFRSAGQRCSACRVVFVHERIADKIISMTKGAMQALNIGNPQSLKTDIGPVIDQAALEGLQTHQKYLDKIGECLYQMPLNNYCNDGTFFAPALYEIKSLSDLKGEVFGPIVHLIRYGSKGIDQVISDINATQFGLTFGIHSRIESFVEKVVANIHVGNVYVNRNMIGAQVGVQPFGGQGLSGTGPKAGGPNYLPRLCHEKTITINTVAVGGNVTLMSKS